MRKYVYFNEMRVKITRLDNRPSRKSVEGIKNILMEIVKL